MTPGISVRLQSMLNGFRDVIIPAINPEETLAMEQAGLIMAQLSMLLNQLPYAERFHRLCRDDARATAAQLLHGPDGGPRSLAAAAALAAQLATPMEDAHAEYLALAEAISALTAAAAEDAAPAWRSRLNPALLDFAIRQNHRERSWTRDAGFDPEPASVPSLAELCGR